MSLRRIVLAALCSLPTLTKAETKPTNTPNNNSPAQNNAPHNNHQLPSYLTLNFGYSRNADDLFRRASASAYVNGLLMTFGYREKTNIQERPGLLEVGDLQIEGTESAELHEFDLSFGLEAYQKSWKHIDVTCFGEVTGGIQEGITKLRTETETIPGAPSIDFLLGGGLKVETVFRLPQRYTKIPLGIGLGLTLEYLSEQIEELPEESNLRKLQVGGYAVVRFAKGR